MSIDVRERNAMVSAAEAALKAICARLRAAEEREAEWREASRNLGDALDKERAEHQATRQELQKATEHERLLEKQLLDMAEQVEALNDILQAQDKDAAQWEPNVNASA